MQLQCLRFILSVSFLLITSSIFSQEIFTKYPWLSSQIDPIECSNIQVTEYDLGSYAFIVIIDNGKELFYYQDGTLFCTGTPTYNCVSAYKLTSDLIGLTFQCETNEDSDNTNCDSNPIVCDFPWLEGSFNFIECEGNIKVYEEGAHQYVLISDANGINMYYNDGTPMCQNSVNYDCPSLYSLDNSDIVNEYKCQETDGFYVDGFLISNSYKIDYLQYGPCPYWDELIIDITEQQDNCTIIDSFEICLSGTITVRDDGTFELGYSHSIPSSGNGFGVAGGSAKGFLQVENETILFCYGAQEDPYYCEETDFFASQDRIEFNLSLEGCPIRVGGRL